MDEPNPPQEPNQTPPNPENNAASSPPASDNANSQPVTVTTDDQSAPASPEPTAPAPAETEPQAAPQATVSDGHKSSKKGLLFGLGVVVVIAGLAVIGYMVTRPQTTEKKVVVVTKKDIPVMNVVAFSPLPHDYYPNIENDNMQADINQQLFEALTKFENGTTLKPGLADSWTNPDSSTWIFKLHPNVTFHTGKTMTATDVKASIDAVKGTDYGQVYASTIKSVEVVDPLTVKITTNAPDPILANELSSLYIYDTTSGKTNDAVNGSGAYVLKSDSPDAIKLTAYDKYWGGHVYTKEVDYLAYQDSKDVPTASLTNHQIQLLTVARDAEFDAKLKGYGYQQTSEPAYAVGHLVFNTSKTGTPFANPKVRVAVAQAIDQKAIVTASNNLGATSASQTVPEGIPGYNPALKPVTFSVTNAKAALTAAGYPNGFTFKLTYFPASQALVEEVKKEMAAIGVTVTLDPQSDQHQLVKIAIGGGTDMYYNVVSSNYVDGSDILSDFIDSPNYTNSTLTALNTQAAKELDPAKRVAILQQMSKMVETDQADIPLFQRQAYVYSSAPGVVYVRDTSATATGVYYWKVYAQ